MMNNKDFQILKEEWASGVLLNPFFLVDDYVQTREKGVVWEADERKEEKTIEVCIKIAEAFLDCTSYRVSETDEMRDGELDLMVAMLLHLYLEAPTNEQNMSMITEMVKADTPAFFNEPTDLERLFDLLNEKDNNHIALLHFNKYLEHPDRFQCAKTMAMRLSPLYSFSSAGENNIFEHCGEDEILEFSVSLLHNCQPKPIPPDFLDDKETEIAFVAAILHLFYDFSKEEQTAKKFIFYTKNPENIDLFASGKAAEYWKKCRTKVLEYEYDKDLIDGIGEFYRVFM
jgi:hypothetical protein